MNKTIFILCLLVGSALGFGCGFGLYDDSGNPTPDTDYWGWVCAYGPVPATFDAGCPAGPCGDGTIPSLVDGGELPDAGEACQCDTGASVSFTNCSGGPCADGTVPTEADAGAPCVCDDGATLPAVDCGATGPCSDGTDPTFATGYLEDDNTNIWVLDGGCHCDDGTSVPSSDCESASGA